ncbi:MAG TPA: NUDIX domain-containing protein [Candidatus Saccharimonadales bacterium]|nr:NUDIX domain-containing protein [Candidatus Saccharimonadales bacterium]
MTTYPPVGVVDENDKEIGAAMLADVWQKGLYHRIASIFIEDEQGRMLLQRRGPDVKLYPNCWDQAAGGHVDEGFTYESTAANELAEELGLRGIKLQTVATYRSTTKEDGKVINQFVRVFLAQIPSNTPLQPQAEEVAQLQWFPPDELKRMITEQPEAFTPGFLYELRTYFSDN